MEPGPVAGFCGPVHRALTEPILLGGAPRAVAIVNGTLAAAVGLGLRLWIAGSALADRPCRRGLGGEARSSLRRCRAPASAHSHPSERVRSDNDEPRRIPPLRHASCRLPAVGRAGRATASSSTRTARSSAPRAFAGPISIPPCRPSSSPSPRGSTTRFVASAPAGRSSSRRSGIRRTPIPEQFPDAASALVDAERRAQFEEEGAHFESVFPDLPLAAAGRGCGARRAVSLRGTGARRHCRWPTRCCAASSIAPIACCR